MHYVVSSASISEGFFPGMALYRAYLISTGCCLLLLAGFFLHSRLHVAEFDRHRLPAQQQLVAELGITDLAIWTEARYTRHPSQADHFTAFQDLPSSLEHFPAGSIMSPPDYELGSRIEFHRQNNRESK